MFAHRKDSFARIHQVFKYIWLFERKFQARNYGQLRILGGIKSVKKTAHEIIDFIGILCSKSHLSLSTLNPIAYGILSFSQLLVEGALFGLHLRKHG